MDAAFVEKLPFLAKPENIVRYEDGVVTMLDRRNYPFEIKFAVCPTYEDVARAIEEMVTQSLGPGYAAAYGMAQAAHEAERETAPGRLARMERAAKRLIATRPTNHDIRTNATAMLAHAKTVIAADGELERAMLADVDALFESRHQMSLALGTYASALIHDGDTILTHCWAETTLIYTLRCALDQGKRVSAFCTETRPYLQGARLTANAVSDMGIPTTVITDNMPAYVLSQGKIQAFFCGTDRVTMDGCVVNKVGTLGIALACKRFGVPFYPFCYAPDLNAKTLADVPIEERNPDETLYCRGVRTATEGVRGYYPAFDATPADLVTGVATDRGVFPPDRLAAYYR